MEKDFAGYDLLSSTGISEYLNNEIKNLKNFLRLFQDNKFLIVLLSPKTGGKGVFSKILINHFPGIFYQIEVGNLIKDFDRLVRSGDRDELVKFLSELMEVYEGIFTVEEIQGFIKDRLILTDQVSVPKCVVVALIKIDMNKHPNKTYILDGFGRTLEQVYMIKRLNQHLQKDKLKIVIVSIGTDKNLIKFKISKRRICSLCRTAKYFEILPSKNIKLMNDSSEIVMLCDNSKCEGYNKEILVVKEGDQNGFKEIETRVNSDEVYISKVKEICLEDFFEYDSLQPIGKYSKFEVQDKETYRIDKLKKIIKKITRFKIKSSSGELYEVIYPAVMAKNFIKDLNSRYHD